MRDLRLALTLGILALAGCAGGGSGSEGSVDSPGSGPVEGTGTLEGLVADEEQRPVTGANVTLAGLARTGLTNAEGRFQFARVPAGDIVLNVTHPLHYPREASVAITPGAPSTVTILMTRRPTVEAYHELFPYAGLQQCMVYTAVFLGSCSHAYTAAYGTLHRNGVNLSQYGAPADPLNNKYRYNFSVRPDHTGIVSELRWTAASEAARYYVLQLSCAYYDAVVDECVAPGQAAPEAQNTYARARGISPLRIEWNHEKPQWLPWVMSRAYLSGPVDRPAGVALEQRIDMSNAVFYGEKVPKDWSHLAPPSA